MWFEFRASSHETCFFLAEIIMDTDLPDLRAYFGIAQGKVSLNWGGRRQKVRLETRRPTDIPTRELT